VSLFSKLRRFLVRYLYSDNVDLKLLLSKNLINENNQKKFSSLNEAEFKVFSQWGEDGIIQYLIGKLPIKNKVFVEFGVEDYEESNTKFLLINNNWSGFIMDGSASNINKIKKSDLYWKYDLLAKQLFITKNNVDDQINLYIKENDYDKEIGLLSIDIDGNDYYVWEAISSIDAVIVICEYNWIFGNRLQLTVPYDEFFVRTKKHFSNLYFGASIQALYLLAERKGYKYVGCTSAGNDAFFVKKDYAEQYLKELITSPEKMFYEQKAKESRDSHGNLTFIRGKDRAKVIEDMNVFNLETKRVEKIKDLQL